MKKTARWVTAGALAATAVGVAPATFSASTAQADPVTCTSTAYLLQVPSGASVSDLMEVDLGTGTVTTTSTLTSMVNAGGYSELDGYIYVWDDDNNGIGRIDSVGTYEYLGAVSGATLPGTIHRGDVSADGYLWLSQGSQVFRVDVRPDAVRAPSEPFLEAVSMPALDPPLTDHKYSQDWVITSTNPDLLYLTSFNDSRKEFALYTYSMSTGVTTSLGILARNFSPLPNMNLRHGGLFSDATGMIYASENRSGDIHRIDPSLSTPEIFYFGPGPASRDNDGVFCRSSLLPIDYGDAPVSYGTMFADNGPRHSMLGPDRSAANTSTLMIGSTVTADADGKPVNLDEDDAFASNPNVTVGIPSVLSVDVTNLLSDTATLFAWYDADLDGSFSASEALAPQTVNPGDTTASIALPAAATEGQTWLRLRLVPSEDDPTTLGGGVFGEVEDWPVRILAPEPGPTPPSPTPGPEPAPDVDPNTLPATGSEATSLPIIGGLVALVLGGAAVFASIRRRLG